MLKNYITKDTKIITIKDKYNINNIYQNSSFDINRIAIDFYKETGIDMSLSMHMLDNWYKIEGEWYLFKKDKGKLFSGSSINELLGEIITKYFKLEPAHYEIAKLENNDLGLVTKRFNKMNETYEFPYYSFYKNNTKDLAIFKYLEELANKDKRYKHLSKDIKKLFIRDFFTSEKDRINSSNIMIKKNDNHFSLAPIYDNEDSFIRGQLDIYKYSNVFGELDITKKSTKKLLLNDDYFQYLLDKLMSFNMKYALNKTENIYNIIIPNENKDNYINHTKEIKQLVKVNKLIKKL